MNFTENQLKRGFVERLNDKWTDVSAFLDQSRCFYTYSHISHTNTHIDKGQLGVQCIAQQHFGCSGEN